MRNKVKVLASISLVGIQFAPAIVGSAYAQDQTVVVTAPRPAPTPAPCPVDAYCAPGGGGGYSGGGGGGGGGGYIPENEATPVAAPAPPTAASIQKQAKAIADGIKMVCPKPGEPYIPTYYNRALTDCQKQVATALGFWATQTITLGACGVQATRMRLAYAGEDTCA